MQIGLDQLVPYLNTHYKTKRIGLLCHAASCASDGTYAIDLVADQADCSVTTLLSPEHGIQGAAQDMEGVETARHPATGLPIYSLYGSTIESLQPTEQMLADIDCLVIDLQDIGTRYYTYIYTMAFCLEACAAAGKSVIVCDRPNPINGVSIEGPLVAPGFQSFVGQYPLSVRHGMTIGELAAYFNAEHEIGAALEVIPMKDWQREQHWDETGLKWINPSPNMRSLNTALLYPGMCLLEATNISEGRGTDFPLDVCGAPWLEVDKFISAFQACAIAGVELSPLSFTPSSRKFAGETCHGIRFRVTDRQAFRPYEFGLALLFVLAQDKEFGWRTPDGNPPHSGLDAGPYEFNTAHPAIDLLTGSDQVRLALQSKASWDELQKLAGPTPEAFLSKRSASLLY